MLKPPNEKEPIRGGTGSLDKLSEWTADKEEYTDRVLARQELQSAGLYPDITEYRSLRQPHLDWFKSRGVKIDALIRPEIVRMAHGKVAAGGHFEEAERVLEDGKLDAGIDHADFLAFPEPADCVYWQPKSGELATWSGRAFALGEAAVTNPATFAFDGFLSVFESPLDWLWAKRDGIVILDWSRAFDRLRDAPRIAVPESLLATYRKYMRPARVPELYVLADRRVAA